MIWQWCWLIKMWFILWMLVKMEGTIMSEERKANKAKRKCIQRKGNSFASRCTISLPRKLEIFSSSTNCMLTVSKSPLNQKIPQPIPQIINTHQPPNTQASSSPQKKASSSKSTSTTSPHPPKTLLQTFAQVSRKTLHCLTQGTLRNRLPQVLWTLNSRNSTFQKTTVFLLKNLTGVYPC
jgi:hypothetical protein